MYEKLVAAAIASPALGKELRLYEKSLNKQYFWQKISCFLTILLIVMSTLSGMIGSSDTPVHQPSVIDLSQEGFESNVNASLDNHEAIDSTNPMMIQSGQPIKFYFAATNIDNVEKSLHPEFYIKDLIEYGTIEQAGDLANVTNDKITWPSETLLPGQTYSQTFVLRINEKLPSYHTTGGKFNCVLSAAYGSKLNLPIECTKSKYVEFFTTYTRLFDVKITTLSLVFFLLILSILTYRTNLLLKELAIVRKNIISGVK